MFPLAGLAMGAAGGAAVGAMLDQGVDRNFRKQVTEELKPGESALFLVFDQMHPTVLQALHPYHARVVQTTLDSDLEARLRRAVNEDA
jgi:uncharacterized membrane protein